MYAYLLISIFCIATGLLLFYFYQKNKKSIIFYAGIGYIIIALPLLFSWFVLLGVAFICIGIIFIALNRFPFPKFFQIILLIAPILTLIVWGYYEEPSYNIFLIPKGYTGRVVIVHDCKNGEEKEFEGRYRVYRISKDGLLKTKFSFAGNSFDSLHSQFYYVDQTGKRETISQDLNKNNIVTVYGLWTLPYEKKKGTNIDFIVDKQVEEANNYMPEENKRWQKEIDSCIE